MHRHRVLRRFGFGLLGVSAVVVVGFVVMGLWNWVMPPLFGLRTIGFWQALGLLVLSRILVGGMGGGGDRHHRRHQRLLDHWERMTPEEREKFRTALRTHAEPEATA